MEYSANEFVTKRVYIRWKRRHVTGQHMLKMIDFKDDNLCNMFSETRSADSKKVCVPVVIDWEICI